MAPRQNVSHQAPAGTDLGFDPEVRLVAPSELEHVFGITYSKRHIDRLEALGKFPKRVALSPSRIAWRYSEVADYVRGLIAARDKV